MADYGCLLISGNTLYSLHSSNFRAYLDNPHATGAYLNVAPYKLQLASWAKLFLGSNLWCMEHGVFVLMMG